MSDHQPDSQFAGIGVELAERGLSIREAAREAGVHEASFRRLLDGRGVHPRTARKIADLFGIRVRELRASVDHDRTAA